MLADGVINGFQGFDRARIKVGFSPVLRVHSVPGVLKVVQRAVFQFFVVDGAQVYVESGFKA